MTLRHLRTNLIAYLALAIALGTGTSYAAERIANGSVTTKARAKNAVTGPKIKKSAVRSPDVKDGTLGSADVADRSLGAVDLADGVVPGPAAGFPTVVNTAAGPGTTPSARS